MSIARLMQMGAAGGGPVSWSASDINTYTLETSGLLTTGQASSGAAFSTDGTKFYGVDGVNFTIYQYSCSIPFDISTVSYDNKSFTTTTGVSETAPQGIKFKPDGTKMFIAGQDVDGVIEYTLSTPWDISTASFSSSKSMLASGNNFTGLSFKTDGTEVYVMNSLDTVNQWSLSVAWDISTATYSNKDFSTNTIDNTGTDLFLSSDGLKLYTNGIVNDNIYQHSLSTAWDISTASYDNIFFSYNTQGVNSYSLTFNDSGTKFYIAFGSTVYQYTA